MPEDNNLEIKKLQPFLDQAHLLDEEQITFLARTDIGISEKLVQLKRFLNFDHERNPLDEFKFITPEQAGTDFLRFLRKPENFKYTCKLLFNIDLQPFQHVALTELWTKSFPMLIFTRGGSKSWLLGLYAMLRLLFEQGCKIAIVGSGFRQAKAIFEYMEGFWYGGDVYRDLLGSQHSNTGKEQGPRRAVDRCEMVVGNSLAFAIPLGTGDKIRGQRANYLLSDEMASIPKEIFDNVVFGFASVSSAPAEKVKQMKQIRLLKAMGQWTKENEDKFRKASRGNQVVLSGTADYTFGHFYKTYTMYRDVIKAGDNPQKMRENEEKNNVGMKASDCCVMRLPATILPEGFMDDKILAMARANATLSTYLKEYDATFPDDSDGFYKMSLVQSCVCPIKTQDNEEDISFDPVIHGAAGYKYVLSIDPASEKDKLAISILECHPNHRRIVYMWSIRRTDHKERVARKIVQEHDYFQYIARKVRDLMKVFNIVEIACDAGGGGIAIEEALSTQPEDASELPIYRIKDPIEEKNPKPTDYMQGLHILNMIQFSSAEWVANANHSLKLDLEQKTLIFPYHDLVSEEIAIEDDKQSGRVIIEKGKEIRLHDSLTSVYEEIEDLKKELVSISYSKTPAGREKWDLPKYKGPDGKFITETKDRYSALLMANASARLITAFDKLPPPKEQKIFGGKVSEFANRRTPDADFYVNMPGWIKNSCQGYGIIKKNKKR